MKPESKPMTFWRYILQAEEAACAKVLRRVLAWHATEAAKETV